MSRPYLGQLIAISEMLNNPQRETVLEAYDLFFDLWLEYSDDAGFDEDLQKIVEAHPELTQKFTDRLNKSSYTEEEKAALLKNIILLYPPETSLGIQAPKKAGEKTPGKIAPKIFISYSHQDESFKNELMVMLAGMQRRGAIDLWQDRRIEVGSDWFAAIQKAMKECDIAVLLVSPDFIASRFVQEVELNKFFQRRIEEGLRVVPIIIRPCLWQNEPIIKNLQALPRDAKPVISFSKDNGDRDQIWVEISIAIENIVNEL